MVRKYRPPAREPISSWLARSSTTATSTPANASSPANISPVGPPPATTTAWSDFGLTTTAQLPRFTQFWLQPAIFRHAGGLPASPGVRYKLRVGRRTFSPFLFHL